MIYEISPGFSPGPWSISEMSQNLTPPLPWRRHFMRGNGQFRSTRIPNKASNEMRDNAEDCPFPSLTVAMPCIAPPIHASVFSLPACYASSSWRFAPAQPFCAHRTPYPPTANLRQRPSPRRQPCPSQRLSSRPHLRVPSSPHPPPHTNPPVSMRLLLKIHPRLTPA